MSALSEALEKIRERAGKATKGPWSIGSIPWKVWGFGGRVTICDVRSAGDEAPVAPGLAVSDAMASNRDFIAAARTDVPALIKACEILQKGMETCAPDATEEKPCWSCRAVDNAWHSDDCPVLILRAALSAAAEALEGKG